jgi:hypothetical protein
VILITDKSSEFDAMQLYNIAAVCSVAGLIFGFGWSTGKYMKKLSKN